MPHVKLAIAAASTTGKTTTISLLKSMGFKANDTEIADETVQDELKGLRARVMREEITWDEYHKTYTPAIIAQAELNGDLDVCFAHSPKEFERAKITYDRLLYAINQSPPTLVIGGMMRWLSKEDNNYDDLRGVSEAYTNAKLFIGNQAGVCHDAEEQKFKGDVILFYTAAELASTILGALHGLSDTMKTDEEMETTPAPAGHDAPASPSKANAFTNKTTGKKSTFLTAKKVKEDGKKRWETKEECEARLKEHFEMDAVDCVWDDSGPMPGWVAAGRKAKKAKPTEDKEEEVKEEPKPEQGEEGNPIPARNEKGESAEEAVARVKEDNPGKEVEFEDPDTPPTAVDLDTLTVAQLKEKLKEKGINSTGNKAALLERLKSNL